MSLGAIAGLVALNATLFVVGAAALYALRGLPSWSDVLRLGGLAYMLGVALCGVTFVFELVVGVPFSLATILVTEAALASVALGAGLYLGRPRPAGTFSPKPVSATQAVFVALLVVYFEALFRSGRLAGLYEFDGWAFWVPKGKAIYFFGGLDHQFFAELPGPSYPPLVPAFEAAAFRFMGSPDVVTLHLQFWFFLLGFVTAVAGLLSGRVPRVFLWPPLLLLLVTPHVVGDALQPEGDFLLDELIALAALLVALWLVEQRSWHLAAATLFLGAAMSTKREGYLLAACVILAAFAASWSRRRAAWPRLAAAAAIAVAVTIPWRVLLQIRSLPRGGPEAGAAGLFAHADRAWPSFRLALSTLFDFDIWLVIAPVAVIAIVLALFAGRRQFGVYTLFLFAFALVAFMWTTWSFPSLPITKDAAFNPISRLTGSLVFSVAALTPVLLAEVWGAKPKPEVTTRRFAPLLVAVAVALLYPLAVLAQGAPHFPSQHECVRPASGDEDLEAVFGRFPTVTAAEALQARAARSGFKNVRVERDGCGFFKVTLHGIPNRQVGADFVREAERVGFRPRLEQGRH
jgi:hypothetical protein